MGLGWNEVWTGPGLRKKREKIDLTWLSQNLISIYDSVKQR
jgi:hypothetical protein